MAWFPFTICCRFLTALWAGCGHGRTQQCLLHPSLPVSSGFSYPQRTRSKWETRGGLFLASLTSSPGTCLTIVTILPHQKAKRYPKNSWHCGAWAGFGCVRLWHRSLMCSSFVRQVLIHSLLSMFHPRPFIKSRFAPQGTVACIRASNDFYYDIAFRWGGFTVVLFHLIAH